MTLYEELHYDIKTGIDNYIRRYHSYAQVPAERRRDIENILTILNGADPILGCQQIKTYLDKMILPLFSWLSFLEVNCFLREIKAHLHKEKYQELNMLRVLIKEKDYLLSNQLKKDEVTIAIEERIEKKLSTLSYELGLLKKENAYLYQTLQKLNLKTNQLEQESANNLLRAQKAEGKLKTYVDYSQISKRKKAVFFPVNISRASVRKSNPARKRWTL